MRPRLFGTARNRVLPAAVPPGRRRRTSAWTGAALSLALLATGALSATAEPIDLPVIDDTGAIEVVEPSADPTVPDLVLPISEDQSEIAPLQLTEDELQLVMPSGETVGGQLASAISATTTVQIAQTFSGGGSTFAVTSDGQVYAWGANGSGQLGDGTTINRTTPVLIEGLSNISQIATDGYSSFALTTNGQVYAWGDNGGLALGDGTNIDRPTPVLIEGLSNIGQLATNGESSLAVTTDGQVYAWGYDGQGQLGVGYIGYSPTPVVIEGLSNISQIAIDRESSFAVTTDGQVYAWGDNGCGLLGDGTTGYSRGTLELIDGLSNISRIATNGSHSFAITTGGQVYAWGCNYWGELGDGTTINRYTPVLIADLSNISQIDINGSNSFAITTGGQVYAWGYNSYGQLGDGTTINRYTPVLIEGLSNITQIAPPFAVTIDGHIYAWGYNENGNLGDGTTINRYTPALIEGLSNITQIATNGSSSFAVTTDGQVYAWGRNNAGELGDGTTINRATPIRILVSLPSTEPSTIDTFTGGTVTITGTAKVGSELIAEASGVSPTPTYTYTWLRGSTLVGTGETYVPTADDVGAKLTAQATATLAGYDAKTLSAETETVEAGAFTDGAVTISGTAKVGSELTAEASGVTPTPVYTYEWLRGSTQVGTGAKYVPTAADLGANLTVKATATLAGYDAKTLSAETETVEAGAFTDGSLTISGTAKVGSELIATASGVTPTPTYTYTWLRGSIPVGTGATYVPTAEDAGAKLTAQATATLAGYEAKTLSAETANVAAGTLTNGAVTIDGTAKVGSELTAVASGVTPTPTYTYTWLRGSTQVGSGATYVPTAADLGAKLTAQATATLAGYTPKDISANSAKIEANITVSVPRNQSSVVDKAITVTLPDAIVSPVGATITYSVTGLPAGLTLNTSTRQITGTPKTVTTDPKEVTVTVKAASGGTASKTFTWTVKAPTITARVPADQSSTVNKKIKAVQVPKAAINSDSTVTYKVTGLPKGLTFDAAKREITGKPTVVLTTPKKVTVKATARGVTSEAYFFWKITK